MTTEMLTAIIALMTEVAGTDYYADDFSITETQCDEVCARCPYADRCGQDELYWGCSCWEESMGEDL